MLCVSDALACRQFDISMNIIPTTICDVTGRLEQLKGLKIDLIMLTNMLVGGDSSFGGISLKIFFVFEDFFF